MLKFLLLLILLLVVWGGWRLLFKSQIQDLIKQRLDLSGWKADPIQPVSSTVPSNTTQEIPLDDVMEQQHFDAVASLLFESEITQTDAAASVQIQQKFLNKMPARTQSQIDQFEQGEWSVYWAYRQQSLEYYVSRYGVSYTHVDRFGVEHRDEVKIEV